MHECDYCGEPTERHIDFLGLWCCDVCWEGEEGEGGFEGMKHWTPERQKELDRKADEVCEMVERRIPEILARHGLPPDAQQSVCLACESLLRADENGDLTCDCTPEERRKHSVRLPDRITEKLFGGESR